MLPDVARPERAGHGARRRRLRQGVAAPPDHGRHSSIGPGRDEHGHGRRASPTPTGCPCCCSPATRSPAASPTPCCSRSSNSATRRSRSTTRSSRSPASGTASCGPSRSPTRCRTRWRRCSTRRRAGRRSSPCPRTCRAEAYDYPERLFEPTVHEIATAATRRRAAARVPAEALAGAERPLIIAGGGVHYSFAEAALAAFAERHNIPVVETVAGKASLLAAHPLNAGPIGVTGCTSANALAAEADVVLAVGTRLQDFTTGSWTRVPRRARPVHRPQHRRLRRRQAPRPAARRRRPRGPRRADARSRRLARHPTSWAERAAAETAQYHRYIDKIASPDADVAGRAADLRPGDRRHRPPGRADRLRRVGRRRLPRRAQQRLAGEGARTASTASTASRAWATRSPAGGGRRWRCPTARSSCSSATART